MKKNKLRIVGIIIALVILASSAIVFAFSPKKNLKPSEYEVVTTYESAMETPKPFIALFYADWCTYCIKFMPKYKTLSNIYKDKYNFVMINADSPKSESIINDYAIGGFPTVYIVDPAIDNRVLISNTLYDDLEKMKKELDRYLRVRLMFK